MSEKDGEVSSEEGLRHRHGGQEDEEKDRDEGTKAVEGSMAAFEDVFDRDDGIEPQRYKITSNEELMPPQGVPERWCACCGFQFDPSKVNDKGLTPTKHSADPDCFFLLIFFFLNHKQSM